MRKIATTILIFWGSFFSLNAQNGGREIINPNANITFNHAAQQALSQRTVWINFLQANGSNWPVLWDEATGVPYLYGRRKLYFTVTAK